MADGSEGRRLGAGSRHQHNDQVAGSFAGGNAATLGFLSDEQSKTYTVIDDPDGAKGSGAMTVANCINNKGQIVEFLR